MARRSEPERRSEHDAASGALPPRLVFFDGDCGLCARSVRWLFARDAGERLFYAPLGGETATRLGHPMALATGDAAGSLVFMREGEVFTRSRAVFALLGEVRSAWRFLRVFRFLPAWLTDLPYRLVARVRYRLFGRGDACGLPSAALRARILP